jgi:hypothetical protein
MPYRSKIPSVSSVCFIEGCGRKVYRRSLCGTHYRRLLRTGDALTSTKRRNHERNACGRPRCPGNTRITDYLDYLRHREAHIKRACEWQSQNKETHKKSKARWLEKNEGYFDSYRRENKTSLAALGAKHRANKRSATPAWLTNEHLGQIRRFFAESARQTKETGIPHEVDHIVPLSGKTVCGLHVPWNLRVITKTENNRRPRIWSDDQPLHQSL